MENKKIKRIVVKIGSSLFCSQDGSLDTGVLTSIVRNQLVPLMREGVQVCVVSSGAIAMGMNILAVKERPTRLSELQACAAVGQNALMNAFEKAMEKGFHCAQLLLTWEDFTDRMRWLNARNTLASLLSHSDNSKRVVPVINENDTVSTNEIKFGDNDQLSARVACLVSADLLVMLSDVDGLMDKDGSLVRLVEKITPELRQLCTGSSKKTSVGGMATKIDAAKICADSGIPSIIANGRKADSIITAVRNPEHAGTYFCAKKDCLDERQRWIAFGTKPKGIILVDDGAKKALCDNKSLLSVGIVASRGTFEEGDIVSVADKNGEKFAVGKVSVSSSVVEAVKGNRFEREILHKDNIVII